MAPQRPITGGDLARWSAALDAAGAARSEVAVGLDFGELGRWHADRQLWQQLRQLPREMRFVEWRCEPHQFEASAVGIGSVPGVDDLAEGIDPERSFAEQPHPLRLSVTGDAIPTEVVPRLLAAPGVASAVVPMSRPPGALRPRPWSWPLRIGAIDDALVRSLRRRTNIAVPSELVDVRDVDADPGAVDVLVVRAPLADAVSALRQVRPVANVVVIAGPAAGSWPVIEAEVAMVRALTGAVAVILVPADTNPTTLARRVSLTVRYLAHGHFLDVAVTAAFERDLLIVAELGALAASALPEQIRARAAELRVDLEALDDSVDGAAARCSLDDFGLLADGPYDQEVASASAAPPLEREVTAVIDDASRERALQVRVRSSEVGPHGSPDNAVRVGANEVDVFVGPEEANALQGLTMSNEALGFTESSLVVRLTAVLVPLVPAGDAVRAEFDVPRAGRSETATLAWTIPTGVRRAQARIMVLHRNRVVQTALLGGDVRTGAAELTERVVLWNDFAHLDDRRPFDAAVVLNHDRSGRPRAITHANGTTSQIMALPELERVSGRIRTFLLAAAFLKGTGTKRAEATRKILIDVAVEGRKLLNQLHGSLLVVERARRIQIVTARPTWFLPLELVYERDAPDDDAVVCERWSNNEECGDSCFPGGDEHRVVCPSAFWGMSRVIERHWVDAADSTATSFLVGASPTRRRRRLAVDGSVLAASKKVVKADLAATQAALGNDVVVAHGWTEWVAAIGAAGAANLLVLMPHTDPAADTMEISGTTLRGGRLEAARHVTGGHDAHPVVMLFGCDTSGSQDNPAGYATLFMQSQAGVVFSTLTMLLNRHAAELSQRLVTLLRDGQRSAQPVGDVLLAFRRSAVRDGLLSALSVTAYGDSDWNV